ncbi:ectonucleotide pyrophosphatase/phosphodiesterase [Sphingomonas mucosissima]|uniref:Type I phosphodiesterase / nucleotide pyrophosphatase n=1 Tax=Sphingomonas mucosissima TaxID=370959 RepID=A0A245ZEI4_9SPHN|nr:ectonucleotide pyrophosphatase/phosphodiesterase [Sphingomonas mucosissima]OWK28157.1 type I phosphodiesterase / nucleotide pyrophosphatase [Sphingomonas mucosissima]
MLRQLIPALAAVSSLAVSLAGCAYPGTPSALPAATAPAPLAAVSAPNEARTPVTILVGIDGFRPDYLDRGITPNLSRLAAEGVTGPMRPSFPSKTYPNHWTLVTGLRPDRHGITANMMEDPARPGEVFTMATDDPFWWNAAPPIWVTAEQAGIRTASMFWPGSTVAWGGTRGAEWPNLLTGGVRPSDWQAFSQQMPGENRVRQVIDWMRRPAGIRPRFVTTYFDVVDTEGHRGGPDAAGVQTAVAEVDRQIGALMMGLAELGQPANLIIVSDHGMAATSSERVVALDRVVPPTDARIVESGPYATFSPLPGREAAVASALLKQHPHMECWRKESIPARFHYGRNVRIPAFLCLAEPGWELMKTAPAQAFARGNHGFDPLHPSMRALFIGNGPSFARGRRLPVFDNVAVAPLLRTLLGLPGDPTLDGTDAVFRPVLRE